MAKARMRVGLAASLMLSWSGAGMAAPPPDVARILSLRPKMEGIVYSMPTPQDQETCKVELIGGGKNGSGWLLKDARGQTLRRFVDSSGSGRVDVFSYYQDGVEVYREIDSNHNQKIDTFRWLNTGGLKWGVDRNEDGKIDTWMQISAEEVSQEVLQALITRDFNRLQPLFITEAEIKGLGVSAAEAQRLMQLQAQAPAKFQTLATKLTGFSDKTHWVRLEGNLPQCQPAGDNGNTLDLVKFGRVTVLYENNGKHDFLQLGDLVLAGKTWRLTEAPTLGDEVTAAAPADPELQKLLDELRTLDAQGGKIEATTPGPNAEAARYNLARADLIGKILAKDKPDQQEQWVRQQAECLSAAAQNSPAADKAAYQLLLTLEQKLVKEAPGGNLTAFVTFREMQADYASKSATPDKDTQTQWLERLTKFVQSYPKAEDTADAIMQLGMISEFANKEVEAKNWYAKLTTDFPTHPLAAKAQGALRRLRLDGQPLELIAPQANGGTFDLRSLGGKVVAVYFWASWDQQYVGDFARLKLLADKNSRDFAVVCVNLDNGPPPANPAVQTPGIQLLQPGGLDSPLATQYGIMTLPNLFLVGKDGKVVSHTVQVGTLEEEVKKALK